MNPVAYVFEIHANKVIDMTPCFTSSKAIDTFTYIVDKYGITITEDVINLGIIYLDNDWAIQLKYL